MLIIFTRHFPSNSAQNPSMRRAELIDGLERNWQEEKRLIDEKSRNNRRTEAERATRRAETIDRLKQNGRLEEQEQLRQWTRAKLARREAINRQQEQKQSMDWSGTAE